MAAAFKTMEGMDFKGKRVLLRADLNVPVQDGKVTDATRIERIVPTIREIIKVGGKAILLSHFGRPKGKVDKAYSLEQVVPAVAEATGHPVGFIDTDWTDVSKAEAAIDSAPEGSILVLENTRFTPGEEENDPALAKKILADNYARMHGLDLETIKRNVGTDQWTRPAGELPAPYSTTSKWEEIQLAQKVGAAATTPPGV